MTNVMLFLFVFIDTPKSFTDHAKITFRSLFCACPCGLKLAIMWIIVVKHNNRLATMSPYNFMGGPWDTELEARRAAMAIWARFPGFILDVWDVESF